MAKTTTGWNKSCFIPDIKKHSGQDVSVGPEYFLLQISRNVRVCLSSRNTRTLIAVITTKKTGWIVYKMLLNTSRPVLSRIWRTNIITAADISCLHVLWKPICSKLMWFKHGPPSHKASNVPPDYQSCIFIEFIIFITIKLVHFKFHVTSQKGF